ncbi:hypothetical protein U1Q18_007825 [Sarracenia purpurea var. burkii]
MILLHCRPNPKFSSKAKENAGDGGEEERRCCSLSLISRSPPDTALIDDASVQNFFSAHCLLLRSVCPLFAPQICLPRRLYFSGLLLQPKPPLKSSLVTSTLRPSLLPHRIKLALASHLLHRCRKPSTKTASHACRRNNEASDRQLNQPESLSPEKPSVLYRKSLREIH